MTLGFDIRSRVGWSDVEASGAIWSNVEPSGAIWGRPEAYENQITYLTKQSKHSRSICWMGGRVPFKSMLTIGKRFYAYAASQVPKTDKTQSSVWTLASENRQPITTEPYTMPLHPQNSATHQPRYTIVGLHTENTVCVYILSSDIGLSWVLLCLPGLSWVQSLLGCRPGLSRGLFS